MARASKAQIERQQRVAKILPILKRLYPDARCSLEHRSPLELLVATILSAQCTDARVNLVTRELFRKYRTAADYANAPTRELEKDIQSTGFYRNKARAIQSMARSLLERHHGNVPQTMQELVELAGVGRKTANVVLGNAFGKNEGIVVDTHVTRLANRLGLTAHKSDAVKIERDLMAVVPREDWTLWSHLLIFHGRQVCDARRPDCAHCPLLPHCPAGP
ncbi:MAG: endonuclease III, partial [Phycisphaerae bacterium]|nr:endonuclease III [Phycisphaerae bacterium]